MNFVQSRDNALSAKLATLLGSASLLTMASAMPAAAQMAAQVEEVPETVLITGSLIRGTVAVGVPVTNLTPQDFAMTGALTSSDLFRTVPQFNVIPGPVATQAANVERGTRVNLRQLDTGSAPRSLFMIDGMRYPPQGNGLCQIDPGIIPEVAIDRIDLLLDGASATYGSDAIGGVINIILKRAYDGARTEVMFRSGNGGNNTYLFSQLWGRTWDGGDITLSYQWSETQPMAAKNVASRLTFNHSPWGLDNRNPIGSSMPGTISTGAQASFDSTNYPAGNGNNCINCYAIPAGSGGNWQSLGNIGPTLPFSAATHLNWTSNILPNHAPTASGPGQVDLVGTQNVFNPYEIADYSAGIQYNAATMTVDQRLTKDISFYGEGIYAIRRSNFRNNATGNQITLAIPTFNPYYPTGGAPNNLRVAYHFGFESPSVTHAYASAQRYQLGLNIALPYGWESQVYYSETRDAEFNHVNGTVNKAAVSAALGWTLPVTPASGTTPAIATWTKPASVPYLNLFCDPRVFQCNSPTSLAYIENFSTTTEAFWVNEKGVKADGPLFNLPGGTVKAAIGANFTSYHFLIQSQNEQSTSPTVALLSDPESRQVWAVFTQVNVPIFSDMNGLPGLRRLEFEASWRHDQYSDVRGTSNPKLAFNWSPITDLTIRGGWGNSFRAPNFGEFSPISNVAWNGWGLQNAAGGAAFPNNANIVIACDPALASALDPQGRPAAGSGAEKLYNAGAGHGAVFGCNSQPAGFSLNGGGKAAVDAGWRNYFNTTELKLEPEISTNWAIGFDYSPTFAFLRGLDIQATYYIVKINNILRNFGNPTTNRFNDPSVGFVYVVPSDLSAGLEAAGRHADAVACAGANAAPQSCQPFEDMVRQALSHPSNTVPLASASYIFWINDGGTMNKGFQKTDGIDFSASYEWDWGNLGAWNTGVVGTYYMHQTGNTDPTTAAGAVITDFYHTTLSPVNGVAMNGVESIPRFKYRARLGWSNGTWSVTGFMDYASHFFHTQTSPPNVNFACITPGGTVGAFGNPTYPNATYPCAINGYTNIEPSYYTFDISVGYDTGDRPANSYLRNIGIQLVVQNITDRHSPYEYRIATGGGNPAAFDILKNVFGRLIQVRLTKTW